MLWLLYVIYMSRNLILDLAVFKIWLIPHWFHFNACIKSFAKASILYQMLNCKIVYTVLVKFGLGTLPNVTKVGCKFWEPSGI